MKCATSDIKNTDLYLYWVVGNIHIVKSGKI